MEDDYNFLSSNVLTLNLAILGTCNFKNVKNGEIEYFIFRIHKLGNCDDEKNEHFWDKIPLDTNDADRTFGCKSEKF